MRWIVLPVLSLLLPAQAAENAYKKPSPALQQALSAPLPPSVSLSPKKDRLLLLQYQRYAALTDLARPMLRLAGERFNPKNWGPHNPPRLEQVQLLNLPEGRKTVLPLPKQGHFSAPSWSPDGRHVAFTNATATSVELWICDTETFRFKKFEGIRLQAVLGDPFDWMPNGQSLLVKTVPEGIGHPPQRPAVPPAPRILEGDGKPAPVRTQQDLLQDAFDTRLFAYYANSQLMTVQVSTGERKNLGSPGLFASMGTSPDGRHILVHRLTEPFSYQVDWELFAQDLDILDLQGRIEHKFAHLPLGEAIPIGGVRKGPRHVHWHPSEPATLLWAEALDEGHPKKKVPHRDKLMRLEAPFKAPAQLCFLLEHRLTALQFGEAPHFAMFRELDRDKMWVKTWFFDPQKPESKRLAWEQSIHERYKDPGRFVTTRNAFGHSVIQMEGQQAFLQGSGATPQGERPFLDRIDIQSLQKVRLFQSQAGSYESVLGVLDPKGDRLLTRYESPTEAPNVFLREKETRRMLTHYADPAPLLRKIKKELVRYRRSDGVELSFTLYLPPDHQAGERHPALVWAYPMEFTDSATAGQVAGSPDRFTIFAGSSPLMMTLAGYAVLYDVTMPVVGDPETVNNTFVEQIVASAQAALNKADEMGVIDPQRVAVSGHSYGAFMTANLMAHCNLFKTGIARSGAYNRTLTPFGFQSERRTLWEARETYQKMSPFNFVDQFKAPILLIHGELDPNPGTFPLQSERMFHALKGNAKIVRYVQLPYEGHGYQARESVEHVLWEMETWLGQHLTKSRNKLQTP